MKYFFYILIFTLSSIACHAQLDSMTFSPVKDNSIYSESSNLSNGAGNNLFAGRTLTSLMRRALLKFDFTGLPNNAQIQRISLKMPILQSSGNTTIPHSFSLHRLTKNWGEGTSAGSGQGAAATTNDATWGNNFYNSSSWTNAGGDFETTASATSNVTFAMFPLQFGTWSSSNMITDVLDWIASPNNNFGWILKGNENLSGSAMKFSSREETFYPKPALVVVFTLPTVDKVLINEVNPQKKWIELYNPSNPSINLNNYWIANGNTSISLANLTVLNGSLTLDSAKYVVINWAGIGGNNGELALFNGNPSTAEMKDYVQYGSATHQRSSAAVTAQVWDNTNNFLPTISADTLTYSLNGNNIYSSGKATNSTSFVTQRQTPTYKNILCPPNISLSGNIVDASYSTSGSLQLTGNMTSTSFSKFTSESFIQLNPNTLIEQGAKFQGQISGCLNN
ncbi:DNRLRE domain-containing protein [Arcicella sp. LKC2W]|uniref:DNRLRE domain-containing protein n=1 Tax=Arcicella sp. LKC2W TaxID=2984198 RepID=UPI002B22015E|nr:DNRLRE domain-containing protein [Arcicella sp. LKC2W]MEA5461251.1 DNRLRE domain-containing protein [Arcicella sp. LKC2W]